MTKYILPIMLLFAALTAKAQSGAPSDDQLKSLCRNAGAAIMTAGGEDSKQKAFDAEVQKLSSQADIRKIKPQQVDMTFESGGTTLAPMLRQWLAPVLDEKAATDGTFAYLAWKYLPENDGFSHTAKETEAFIRFVKNKDLQKLMDQNEDLAADVLSSLSTAKDVNWHTPGFAPGIVKFLGCNLPDNAVMDCVKAFNSAARVDTFDDLADGYNAKVREQLRTICLNKYKTLASTLESARKKKLCAEQITYLEGPFACGTLVGGKAPALHFLKAWQVNGDNVAEKPIKTLDDLKGKVVMLDFWGTKCVPCLLSFPELAEMQAELAGEDVVILGVTSLQGYFVDTPNKRTIQCRNNPEKELSLFPDYFKAMGMTWTIGISEEDVMNTDYGALAIPHVVIIDKEGIVRHNAVNADKETKIKMIKELL